jgi:Mrp family chromosome partitioning ATPase
MIDLIDYLNRKDVLKMSENCSHDCNSCGVDCASRSPQSLILEPHKESRIGKVIGVVSGKGGVGKSMVSSLLAVNLQRKGYRTAIMDADITGPSIPKALGITKHAVGTETAIFPVESATGIQTMSVNLLLEDSNDPVIWRGPVIAGTVRQFWSDVVWKDVDYMVVDMPPGTGDVPLTVFQSVPVDGIVIVTSPQELVSMIVGKAVRMAQMMNVPILGIVENMSYVECPDCKKQIKIFGESHVDEVADEYGLPVLARIPITPEIAAASDNGTVEHLEGDWLQKAVETIEALS